MHRTEDIYDYIFVTVRAEQLHQALSELRDNQSPTVVTMVNSLESYECWETLCGKGRKRRNGHAAPGILRIFKQCAGIAVVTYGGYLCLILYLFDYVFIYFLIERTETIIASKTCGANKWITMDIKLSIRKPLPYSETRMAGNIINGLLYGESRL
ncbi:hypothetical protein SAMN02745823_01075 [Sporobacter termitidis DSM 10068]|uniref:Ketopantoate reductase N-terminal domain-containing protein n=1 Tax=Sporobacter termitidis DSM 10068 TaxID=1123282 RepID=A0A1M5W582_9FIRM|nr:hypothetical protein SAMN02745823_01075 [Sporobacter termitidis DSM 10068]